jgi:hypothetical protein
VYVIKKEQKCELPKHHKKSKRQQKKPHHTHQPIQQTRAKPEATIHSNTLTVILLIESTSLKRKETEIVVGAEIASLSTATRVFTY